MAAVRRHWRALVINLLLLCWGGVLLLFFFASRPAKTTASELQQSATKLERTIYSQVQLLRDQLCLTNSTLAAMGCSQPQTEQVMSQLLNWYQQNKSLLDRHRLAQRQAQRELREAGHRINIGPRDEQLLSRLPALHQSVANADQQYQQFVQTAASAAGTGLDSAQQQIWSNVRANKDVPEAYRFASKLDAEQIKTLRVKLSKQARGSIDARTALVGPSQQQASDAARNKHAVHIEGVLKAEEAVLGGNPFTIDTAAAELSQ